jgi:hypothetical protein
VLPCQDQGVMGFAADRRAKQMSVDSNRREEHKLLAYVVPYAIPLRDTSTRYFYAIPLSQRLPPRSALHGCFERLNALGFQSVSTVFNQCFQANPTIVPFDSSSRGREALPIDSTVSFFPPTIPLPALVPSLGYGLSSLAALKPT